MDTYKVIDDFIPKSYQDAIQKHVLGVMSWNFLDSVSGVEDHNPQFNDDTFLAKDQDTFYRDVSHPIYGISDEFVFGLLTPMSYQAQHHLGFDSTIERIRISMYHNADGGAHRPHVDYYYPHWTMIYYVHDSDGPTIIYEEKVENMDRTYPSKFNVIDKIEPRAGRAVLLDGSYYHSSSTPAKNRTRTVINFNFVPLGGGEKDQNYSKMY